MSKIRIVIMLIILFTFIIGLIMCFFIYPFFISLSYVGQNDNANLIFNSTDGVHKAQLYFYWFCSIPCFGMLVLFFIFSIKYNINNLNYNVIKMLKISSIILFVDLVVYLIGNLVLAISKIDSFAIVYLFVDLIGFAFEFIFIYFINLLKQIIDMKQIDNSNYSLCDL